MDYSTICKRNGILWVARQCSKVVVSQILKTIKPKFLRMGLECDIDLIYLQSKKGFKKFRRQPLKLSDEFQVLHKLVPKNNEKAGRSTKAMDLKDGSNDKKGNPQISFILSPQQAQEKKLHHKIEDCWNSRTKEPKQALYDKLRAERATYGALKNIRSKRQDQVTSNEVTSRLEKECSSSQTPDCQMHVKGERVFLSFFGICYNGNDALVSPIEAWKVVLEGTGHFITITWNSLLCSGSGKTRLLQIIHFLRS